jgi:hypothetical protein
MHPGCRLHNTADLALVQAEGSLLKLLLHVACSKEATGRLSQYTCPTQLPRTTHRSPPLRALLQSDSVVASSDSDLPLGSLESFSYAVICSRYTCIASIASSLDRVMRGSRQLAGRRLSRCFTSRCAARILSPWFARFAGVTPLELWYFAMNPFSLSGSVPAGGSHRESLVAGWK